MEDVVIPGVLWIPWLFYSQSSVFEVSLQDLALECPGFQDLGQQNDHTQAVQP